jgi:nicotine blue oxidoreductase
VSEGPPGPEPGADAEAIEASPLAVVVLAAGAGTRFGGTKQLATVDGVPLLARVLDVLDGVGERRIVVLGAHAEEVEPLVAARRGWTVARALDWETGPGASLRAGLRAAPEADAVLIVLGDLAWLQPDAVDRVLDAAATAPREVEAVRAFEGEAPGHPLFLRGSLLEQARSAPDDGLRPLLSSSYLARVECSGLGVARDVDTVADLEAG